MNTKRRGWLVLFGAAAITAGGVFCFFYRKPATTEQPKILSTQIPETAAVPAKPLQAGSAWTNTPAFRPFKIPILMYHHVGQAPGDANATRLDLTVSPENFAAQVAWLKARGYQSVSLQDLYLYAQGRFQMPSKPVIFTFDDGYQDVFDNAIPILKMSGFSGSFGIITNFPGTTQGTNVYASWRTIRQAAAAGQEIVSHTENHFDGRSPQFSSGYIYQNLAGSLAALQANAGVKSSLLIYPFGHYTPPYLAAARRTGITMGVTTRESDVVNLADLMEIPRVRVHGAETLRRFEDMILDRQPASTTPASIH